MMFRKHAKELTAMVIVLVLLTLALTPQTPVHAESALDLQMSSAGALSWNLYNLKPGDSGTALVTLRNVSNMSGVLAIWLSNVIDREGANPEAESGDTSEPGELSGHLLLQPSAPHLSTSLALPALVASFPQSVDTAPKILVNPVAPGEIINLTWRWYLPSDTNNSVQGDTLAFTINYYLEGIPAPSSTDDGGNSTPGIPTSPPSAPAPVGSFLEIVSSGQNVDVSIKDNGSTTQTHVITLLDNQFILNIDTGTVITTKDNAVPQRLEVSVSSTVPPVPAGMTIISPFYSISAQYDMVTQEAFFSKPAYITLAYNPADLPQDITGLFIASYDEELGWIQLQSVEDFIASGDKLTALINRSANIAILALRTPEPEITEPPSVPAPAPVSLLRARLETNNLVLSAKQIRPGDSVTIRLSISNSGQMSGERLLTLKMNGLFIDSQLVRLKAGQERTISFSATPFIPGDYEVEIDGLTQGFTVIENPQFAALTKIIMVFGLPVPAIPFAIVSGAVAVVLVLFFFIFRK